MITKDKIILVDADGCLLNWILSFNVFMHELGLPQIPATDSNYSIQTRHGITHEQGRQLIKEFNCSNFIKSLHAFADSKKYVAMLNEKGYSFVVITSLGDDTESYNNRAENPRLHFGDAIAGLYCLPVGIAKAKTLEYWEGLNYFWIEDHVENAIAGAKLGLRAIVINQPYNSNYIENDDLLHARVSYATPWKEIYDIIIREDK